MMTAPPDGNLARWQEAFDNLMSRVAGRFARVEPRRRMGKLARDANAEVVARAYLGDVG